MHKNLKYLPLLVLGSALIYFSCSTRKEEELALTYPDPDVEYSEERERCGDYNIYRNLYFGDLHAHSSLSWDAFGYDVTVTVEEGFKFARGETVRLPPLDQNGVGTRPIKIDRPLDFVAMTEHIEFVGENLICNDPESAVYDSDDCRSMREGGANNISRFGILLTNPAPERVEEICGPNGRACIEKSKEAWKMIRNAAEATYDKTSTCSLTTFNGYEFTSSIGVVNRHRNVIFRNADVPEVPAAFFENPTPEKLWDNLETDCLAPGANCDVMVIPHNSNWSNGHMFTPPPEAEKSIESIRAALGRRLKMEPLVEAFQHKGDTECKNGFDGIEEDPYCDFEKIHHGDFEDCGDTPGWGGVNALGCISRFDFMRNVFKAGLALKRILGVNPYKFGVIGSTDTHNGSPGNVAEHYFPGHVGLTDDTKARRLSRGTITHNPITYNPGGLVATWAYENSRDAIFDAFRRRETYVTSGPRIALRFFAGWNYPKNACDGDIAKIGYTRGVAMGDSLPPKPGGASAPRFIVSAEKDPGTAERPGSGLAVIQIIKGWIDQNGSVHEKIYAAAGDEDAQTQLDRETCAPPEGGFDNLCSVWSDPDFKPGEDAFYYARAIEVPSCRWAAYDCLPTTEGEQPPDNCDDPDIKKVIQERAWTSPIWYETDND